MKLQPQTANRVFLLLVSAAMSFFMSFAMTALNLGFTAFFVQAWLQSFVISFFVSLPIAVFVIPVIRHTVDGWTVNEGARQS
jgi:membrane protein YdbS with pleckstrin-like domain